LRCSARDCGVAVCRVRTSPTGRGGGGVPMGIADDP